MKVEENFEEALEDRKRGQFSVWPTLFGVAVLLLVCAIVIIIGMASRSTGGLAVPSDYNVVHVDEFTYGFRLATTTVPAGNNLFVDQNQSSIPHEFVLFKTDLPAVHLPLGPDGNVDEESKSLEDVLDSGSNIPPGHTRLLTVDLAPGHYALVCNLPGHYKFGMYVDITVK